MTGKQVIKILESHGWKVLRINGSRDLGKGLVTAIEKQTGVQLK